MKRKTLGKAALSSLLVATTMVGCGGAAFWRPSAKVVKEKESGQKLAAVTEKALAERDFVRALEAAEGAVALSPRDATYRQLLGRAYVANGRFASAETALGDAMTLGNSDPRTVISLALVKVGLGKNDEARRLLADNAATLPAADYGLAMAMAGDAAEGVRVLSEAIHDPSANARTRQNLAYAYALAGRWKDSRMMAGEDLEPLAAAQRVSQWAMMAEPSMGAQRVAALMGVTLNAADAGLPVRLALAPEAPADATQTMMADAAADAPPVVEAAPEAPVAVAAVETVPVPAAEAAPVAAKPVRVADFVVEDPAKAKPAAAKPATPAKAVMAQAAPAAKMQKVAMFKPVSNGASAWVVQLGAYDSAAIAKEKWTRMATVNSSIAAFPVLTSQANVGGKTYHRVAINGFATRNDAMAMCRAIKAQKGQCFVREGAPGATPQRWALATKGRQYASR